MPDEVLSSPLGAMRNRIQEFLVHSRAGATVNEQVVQHFIKLETDRRVALIIDGMKRLMAAETELLAIKPDHNIFGDDGVIVSQGWSAAQKNKKERAQKLVKRLTDVLHVAVSNSEFKMLEEALKGGAKDGDA